MVLSMLRSFGEIGPQIDQIWAWLSRGHRWSPGVRNPLKSSVTGPSLLVNCYLEIKFYKIIRVNPPPPPNFKELWEILIFSEIFGRPNFHKPPPPPVRECPKFQNHPPPPPPPHLPDVLCRRPLTYPFYIIYLFYFKKTKDQHAWLVFEIDFPCLKT